MLSLTTIPVKADFTDGVFLGQEQGVSEHSTDTCNGHSSEATTRRGPRTVGRSGSPCAGPDRPAEARPTGWTPRLFSASPAGLSLQGFHPHAGAHGRAPGAIFRAASCRDQPGALSGGNRPGARHRACPACPAVACAREARVDRAPRRERRWPLALALLDPRRREGAGADQGFGGTA